MIGPNGAGKTTLLSILAGIQRADDGSVSQARGEIGWVPQQAALYGKLTVAREPASCSPAWRRSTTRRPPSSGCSS